MIHLRRPRGRAVTGGGRYTHLPAVQFWPLGQTLPQAPQLVRSVAVSPDSRYALSGSWDKTLRIWRLPGSVDDLVRALEEEDTSSLASLAKDIELMGAGVKKAIPLCFKALKSKCLCIEGLKMLSTLMEQSFSSTIEHTRELWYCSLQEQALRVIYGDR